MAAKTQATSTHFNAVRSVLKRAGFFSASKWRNVPDRYNQNWTEGFRVAPYGPLDTSTRVFYQKPFYTAHDTAVEAEHAELYRAALEQAGYTCYVNGRREVIVTGLRIGHIIETKECP